MKTRSQISKFGRLCDGALVALWLTSALGHAWLLVARGAEFDLWQRLMLVVAVAGSLALARCSRWLRLRPAGLLIVALLVCLAHASPADLQAALGFLPPVFTAVGLLGLRAVEPWGRVSVTPPGVLAPVGPESFIAKLPPLGFSLFRRPPPML